MGIKTETITTVTCDICKAECKQSYGDITIQVNSGDGRDVGPATIDGSIHFNQPYGVSGGIICTACKMKWLDKYVTDYKRSVGEKIDVKPWDKLSVCGRGA